MNKLRTVVFAAAGIASLSGLLSAQTAAGNAENGKRLFIKMDCYYCHGTDGQGGRDGARIAQTTLNAQGLIRYVRRPAGAMPPFNEKMISDQDLTDIYAYLKSVTAKQPKDIPLLDQLRAK